MKDKQDTTDLARRIEFAPAKQRMEMIISSDDAEALVAAMEPMDVYLTIKEVGELDSAELFELAHPEQVRCMLDLECWHKDCQHPQLTRKWIGMLMQLEDDRFLENVKSLDLAFVMLYLKRQIQVFKLDDVSSDVLDSERPIFTSPDGRYLIENIDDNEQHSALVNRFILRINRIDIELFNRLIEGVYYGLESNLEEEAFEDKVRRLGDRGIPEYYDAIEIYSPLDPQRFQPQARLRGMYSAMEGSPPAYPMRVGDSESLLANALVNEADNVELREELNWDLAMLSNKVLVADIVELGSTENVRDVLERIQHTLNIGLEYLSGGVLQRARELLREIYAVDLFRLGHSLLISYARRARISLRAIRLSEQHSTLALLDSPLRETMEGVLADRPQWYEGQDGGGRHRYRDFHDLRDIQRMELFIARIEGLWALMRCLLGEDFTPLDEHDLAGTNHADSGGLTIGTLLCTALSNLMLRQSFDFSALSRSDLTELRDKLGADRGPNADPQVLRDFMTYAATSCQKLTAADLERAQELAQVFVDELAQELHTTAELSRADLRYLRSLIVSF
ncbi:MAG: DUF6178 family protein [Candidatus Alcyoniella australis]|nr:DUF6178 family protein [Candidatus Alcyoniella australis]